MRILQFLVFSERPLRIEEVVDAIAVDPEGSPRFDPKNRERVPREVTRYCSSLVVVVPREAHQDDQNNKNTMELQLAHDTVREFLITEQLKEELRPHFMEIAAGGIGQRPREGG
jgi:hypothetical protein